MVGPDLKRHKARRRPSNGHETDTTTADDDGKEFARDHFQVEDGIAET
jgi:hypothetical protein